MFKPLLTQLALATSMVAAPLAHAANPVIDVYKTSSCGCCKAWIDHLKGNGFTVRSHDVEAPEVMRAKFGIPEQYGSCHTGLVKGYAVEGHVPADAIKQMLKQKPKAAGIAVPGMPIGSPGMEGSHKQAFDVMLVSKKGTATVFKHYKGD